MTRLETGPTDHQRQRSRRVSRTSSAATMVRREGGPAADRLLDEVEAVARIGSYSLDIPSGHWVSSRGLDAILGIDPAFERSLEGWASVVHPAERAAMLAYFAEEVLGWGRPFDRQYRVVRPDTGEMRVVHGRGALEFDGSGRALRMFGTIADITEQRSAQEALVASELRYAAIFEGTALRAAESSLAAEFRERAQVAAALARLQPGPSAEATAAEMCDELVGLPGIDVAAIFNFLDPGRAVPLAVVGPAGLPVVPGRPLPTARAAYLYERAAQGPWAEAWRPRPADGRYGQTMAELGIRAIAYAPIRNGDGLLALVAAGTRDETYARHLIDHLPAVGEFAATASALLSGQLERGHRDARVRKRIEHVLAKRSFVPVFQPIVALASGELVGYEALSRFADGTPPDLMIAEAHSVGLGRELELACLAAALAASESLAADCWLSLNVSPDAILHASELGALLAGPARRIVLEITEHVEIDDYPAVHRAVAGFRPTVSLAVDDAGAGFASLRHVVELRPQFLKLDISLVRDVDRDATRQAMIAGLRNFAGRVGCEVIAEGIEERAELEMLRELGVPLGQGYLLGRPVSRPVVLGDGAGRRRTPRPRRAIAGIADQVVAGDRRPAARRRPGA